MPHIHNHQVSEDEVIEVLDKPAEDRPGREGARIVITAYDLAGRPLAAFRRRRRKKQQ
jgi:hypothetical protein